MSEYRHEYKYLCSMQKLAIIRNQIEPLMYLDNYTRDKGIYTIRSLYFDDYENRGFYENANGTVPREKFRLRIYNSDASYIKLELKKKDYTKVKKLSCLLPKELCHEIMDGRPLPIQAVDSPVYRKFCLQQNTRLLQPKVIVEYDRVPFVYPDGNVRVTFDMHIRNSNQLERFLEPEIASRLVMPINQHILEVKFDEYIPDFIYQTVKTEKLRQTTFSKYYICRNPEEYGGLYI